MDDLKKTFKKNCRKIIAGDMKKQEYIDICNEILAMEDEDDDDIFDEIEMDEDDDDDDIFDDIDFDIDSDNISVLPPNVNFGFTNDDKGIDNSKRLPILPLRNMVAFPDVVIPVSIGRKKSLKLIKETFKKGDRVIGIVAQKDDFQEHPSSDDLYTTGCWGKIVKLIEESDNTTTAIIHCKQIIKINKFVSDEPYDGAYVSLENEIKPKTRDEKEEFVTVIDVIKQILHNIIKMSSEEISAPLSFALNTIENNFFLINFISSNSKLPVETKQNLLEDLSILKRSRSLLSHLGIVESKLSLKHDLYKETKDRLDDQQREYFLQEELKTIRKELGDDPVSPIDKEIHDLYEKGKKKKWDKKVYAYFKTEVDKLSHLHPASSEYSLQIGYLKVMLELPWNKKTKDRFDMDYAQKTLDKDHYGLEKVKDRILEYLAVLKLKGDLKSPILCLYGPPGVGKTSLGKSIAKSLGRKYVRMSLGGLSDEAEIRGHRRTYIGSMPGRILYNIKKADSSNPVFVLDEIDKLTKNSQGDPSSALLEVLDPEQNNTFHDNYLDYDYDLSNVMFIATANNINTISAPLLDRMEMINVGGYIVEEKIEIAKKHLIPNQLKKHGIRASQLKLDAKTIEDIIEKYTRESGVRELDKRIAKLVRRVAKKIAFKEEYNKTITSESLEEYLGKPIYNREIYDGNSFAGVVTGLAWTAVGGDILFIETSLNKGKGKLTITGNLGDVMKESVTIGLSVLKSRADKLNIPHKAFDEWDIHVHVPEGAIPKDGPSAGITMVTSLASAFTQRKVKEHIAMTGEITLRGKVLPVGGIREKILAAKRSNINEIILSEQNRKDVEDIKDIYIKGLKFNYVNNIDEVLEIALLTEKVENSIKL